MGKLDKGFDKAGLPGTKSGPLGHAEPWCKGMDYLEKRAAEAYAKERALQSGATFCRSPQPTAFPQTLPSWNVRTTWPCMQLSVSAKDLFQLWSPKSCPTATTPSLSAPQSLRKSSLRSMQLLHCTTFTWRD